MKPLIRPRPIFEAWCPPEDDPSQQVCRDPLSLRPKQQRSWVTVTLSRLKGWPPPLPQASSPPTGQTLTVEATALDLGLLLALSLPYNFVQPV